MEQHRASKMTLIRRENSCASEAQNVSIVSVVRHPKFHESQRSNFKAKPDPRYQGLTAWLSAAVIGGLACGFITFLLLGVPQQSARRWVRADGQAITQTIVPVTHREEVESQTPESRSVAAVPDFKSAAELEQVRTRNRRLEALVKVLRQRDANDRRALAVAHSN